MNALQAISKIKETIKIEQLFLENALIHRESSIAGDVFVNADNTHNYRFEADKLRGRVNYKLVQFASHELGLCLLDEFKFSITRTLKGTELEPLTRVLNTHQIGSEIEVLEYLDDLNQLLSIDENLFERMLAHTMVFEKLDKNRWYASTNLDAETINEAVSKVKFNNFSVSALSSVEDGSFYTNADNMISFAKLINNICGTPLAQLTPKHIKDQLGRIDAFSEKDLVKEFGGVQFTALKGGKIKITVSKEIAKKLEEKVKPFLDDFSLLFIKI